MSYYYCTVKNMHLYTRSQVGCSLLYIILYICVCVYKDFDTEIS